MLGGVAARAELLDDEAPTQPAVSEYAPVVDLQAMIAETMEDLANDLADAEEYGPAQQNRVALNANTLAALAMALDNHDEENDLQGSSANFLDAALALSSASDDYDEAAAQLTELQAAYEATDMGEAVEWDAVVDIALLMRHVPIVNNSLRRGVDGRRFDRNTEKNLALAAGLAAMAQAARYDLNYAYDDEAIARWQQICDDMRDASAQVAEAVRAGDQETAVAGLDAIVETCDACHHEFRD